MLFWALVLVSSTRVYVPHRRPIVSLVVDVAPMATKNPVRPFVSQPGIAAQWPEVVDCGCLPNVARIPQAKALAIPTYVAGATPQKFSEIAPV